MSREAYYDYRAPEYDDFWERRRRYAAAPADWLAERDEVFAVIGALPPKRTLDVACGTGFVTRLLPGDVTALDHSARMLAVARRRAPGALLVRGDALRLPFEPDSFERVFTSHFYGHLESVERTAFLAEAHRVAPELIVFDAALHGGAPRDERQERTLNDGSRWTVYKRFFSAETLAAELGDRCEVLHEGRWFVLVRTARDGGIAGYGP